MKLSYLWCKIGIFALAISGLYSVVLVLLRSPGISDLITNKDFFRTALVIHVDLSVLVWMLAGSCVIWLQHISNCAIQDAVRIISKLAFAGIVLILISPLTSLEATPILNNYIPMLDNFWFVLGLSIFASSVLIISMLTLPNTGSIIFLNTALCLVLSYQKLQQEIIYPIDLHGFYEMLFWSPGHILQFLYMHTMCISLITILTSNPVFPKLHKITSFANLFMALLILPAHFLYNIDSAEFIEYCTNHMKYAGGIAASGILLSIICELLYSHSPWRIGAIFSLILFGTGGVIGLLISGTNVTIPAHYHGSVVGISLSIMCLVYFLLEIKDSLLFKAKIQIIVYSIGQMLHIGGLAWSGGYGVLRKDPSTALSIKAKIAMGVMGLGGMLAVIGGLMFVVICVRRIISVIIIERKP
jgi:cytochrome c oxidase subunit 1